MMTSTTVRRKKAHRGEARVLTHIVLFFLLGALFIGLGIWGKSMTADALANSAVTTRVNVFKDKSTGLEGQLKQIMLLHTDNTSLINNKVLSAKRSAVNNMIQSRAEAGEFEDFILQDAIAVYRDKAVELLNETDPAAAEEMKKAVDDAAPAIIIGLSAQADKVSEGITAKDVKGRMNAANTEHYIVIYYDSAFLVMGIAFLLVAAVLLILYVKKDSDGRARVGAFIEPYDYLLPFLIGVGVFTLYPMIRVLVMSFQENYHLIGNNLGAHDGWGLGNYLFILKGSGKTQFLRSLRNTALYVLFTVPITAALALVVAYLLNQKTKLNALFQTAYFMPMVTTATAVGLVWRWLFNQKSGLINAIITSFTHLFGSPANINWLQTGATNHVIPMTVLIIYGIWSSMPFTIILLLSGLQNIDENLYTVAKVDGSKPARIFFRITVPLLSPTIGLVLIINSISAFKVYTDVFVLWSGKPEDYQMETVAWYIYNNITSTTDGLHSLGIAAAAAMVLFVIIFVFTMLQKLIQRKWVYQ